MDAKFSTSSEFVEIARKLSVRCGILDPEPLSVAHSNHKVVMASHAVLSVWCLRRLPLLARQDQERLRPFIRFAIEVQNQTLIRC